MGKWAVLVLVAALEAGCSTGITGPPRLERCIMFQPPLAIGTQYGSPAGHHIGDVVLTEKNINMSVQPFSVAGSSFFNLAYINNPPIQFGQSPALRLNNVSVKFDFSQLSPTVSEATFSFLDQGGTSNIGINQNPPYVGDIFGVPKVMAGSNIVVSKKIPVAGAAKAAAGKIAINGQISHLLIGGQELWIDQVCSS